MEVRRCADMLCCRCGGAQVWRCAGVRICCVAGVQVGTVLRDYLTDPGYLLRHSLHLRGADRRQLARLKSKNHEITVVVMYAHSRAE